MRYASDQGLLGPTARCAGMVALAMTLVAGAEWLRRRPLLPSDLVDLAPQALATSGMTRAVLHGDWIPAVLRPLLATAALIVAIFGAAGLWFDRRAPHPLRWSAPAAVPVMALACE